MKKILPIFLVVVLLSACFSKPSPQELEMMSAPNNYIWLAAKEKFSFMPIVQESQKEGFILTNWAYVGKQTDEQFKFGVLISSPTLKADSLKVEVYKRIRDGHEWIERNPDNRVALKVEKAILIRAGQLYRENLKNEKGSD